MNRRHFAKMGAALSAAAGFSLGTIPVKGEVLEREPKKFKYQDGKSPWPICLDTATIRPSKIREKIRIAAKAGFDAIEPWDSDLAEFEEEGGDLKDLAKEIKDLGLFVPSMIGLWNALPPSRKEFEKSLTDTRNRMRMASAIGAQHVQTIPNTVGENYDPRWVAEMYREIIEIGMNDYQINPALVFVKFFPLKRLSQAVEVAIDANHPQAKIIPDVYHMYISDSGFEGLKLLKGDSIAIFQFNDAPATPSKNELNDSHRVYPGDGILPLTDILKDLLFIGYKGCISLELYNETYWKQDHFEVAKTGLRKTLEVIEKAVG